MGPIAPDMRPLTTRPHRFVPRYHWCTWLRHSWPALARHLGRLLLNRELKHPPFFPPPFILLTLGRTQAAAWYSNRAGLVATDNKVSTSRQQQRQQGALPQAPLYRLSDDGKAAQLRSSQGGTSML